MIVTLNIPNGDYMEMYVFSMDVILTQIFNNPRLVEHTDTEPIQGAK